MRLTILAGIGVFLLSVLSVGCGRGVVASPTPRPTIEYITLTPTSTPTASPTPTMTPTMTPSPTPVPATPIPTVAPPPQADTAAQSASLSSVDAILEAAGWPQYLWSWAEYIIDHESRGHPDVVSWTGEAYGLFQIIPGHFSECGYPFSEWTDPLVNAEVAWCTYQIYGPSAWSTNPG